MTPGMLYIGDSQAHLKFLNAYNKKTLPTNDVPFIKQNCAQEGCTAQFGYFSKTGRHKPEYRGAKCEKHSKGGKLR